MNVAVDTLNHRVLVDGVPRGSKGSGAGEFHYPSAAMIVNSRAYIVDSWNHRIQVFDLPEWKFAFEFGGFFCPKWIALLHRDTPLLAVVDTNHRRLSFHDLDGNPTSTVELDYERFPVRADSQGRDALNVTYENGHAQIVGWGFASKWQKPMSVVKDLNGYFYVSDFGNRTVEKFDASGRFLARILGPEELVTPRRMLMHFGDLLVADYPSDSIYVCDTFQNTVRKWEYPFSSPGLIGRDWNQNLWIGSYALEASDDGARFMVFDRNYQFLRHAHFVESRQPASIAFYDGRVFIADQHAASVLIFDIEGRLQESVPAGPAIRCVAHDGDGNMHIGNYPVMDLQWDPLTKEMYELDFVTKAVRCKPVFRDLSFEFTENWSKAAAD